MAMMSLTTFGQNQVYSTIAKNINPDGISLHHDLNSTGDTLHLKSDYKLYKVEFIGDTDSQVFMIEGAKREAFIPLSSVPVGEYTIAGFQIERSDDIHQYQKTIIFRVSRLLPIPPPIENEEDYIAEINPDINEDVPVIEDETEFEIVQNSVPSKNKKLQKSRKKKSRIVEIKEPKLDITVYKTYDLSTQRGGRYVVQSRSEYRSQNLRPNGKPYN